MCFSGQQNMMWGASVGLFFLHPTAGPVNFQPASQDQAAGAGGVQRRRQSEKSRTVATWSRYINLWTCAESCAEVQRGHSTHDMVMTWCAAGQMFVRRCSDLCRRSQTTATQTRAAYHGPTSRWIQRLGRPASRRPHSRRRQHKHSSGLGRCQSRFSISDSFGMGMDERPGRSS
jgi:hypothetical protein